MFSKWIFTLSISTKKFLWYSPHSFIQGIWKKFLLLTFYTQQLVKSKQFLFGHSPTGALGLRFHFPKSKGFFFYFGWKQNRVSEIPTGYLNLDFNFSSSRCFFPCNFFHLHRGLFVFLNWISNHFIECTPPSSFWKAFYFSHTQRLLIGDFQHLKMEWLMSEIFEPPFFLSYSTQTFVKSYWVLFSFNSNKCFFLLPFPTPQCLFCTRGFPRFHWFFQGKWVGKFNF